MARTIRPPIPTISHRLSSPTVSFAIVAMQSFGVREYLSRLKRRFLLSSKDKKGRTRDRPQTTNCNNTERPEAVPAEIEMPAPARTVGPDCAPWWSNLDPPALAPSLAATATRSISFAPVDSPLPQCPPFLVSVGDGSGAGRGTKLFRRRTPHPGRPQVKKDCALIGLGPLGVFMRAFVAGLLIASARLVGDSRRVFIGQDQDRHCDAEEGRGWDEC